jgi:hypothetical protein
LYKCTQRTKKKTYQFDNNGKVQNANNLKLEGKIKVDMMGKGEGRNFLKRMKMRKKNLDEN